MTVKTLPDERAAGRRKLAAQGKALPDGTDPIPDLCLAGDIHVALLDGREIPIADLAGQDAWIYAYDLARRAIVPALATNIRLTLDTADLVEVRLDSGESIRCTANHPFLMRNGEYVHAGNLLPGDSLMPLYRKYVMNGPGSYQKIWQPFHARWEMTHQMVCREVTGATEPRDGRSVHHVSGDSLDNRPENLVSLTRSEHAQMHRSDPHWSAEHCGEMSRRRWDQPGAKDRMREAMRASNRRRDESGEMTWDEFNARSNAAKRKVVEDKLASVEGGMEAVHAWYMGGATFAELAAATGVSRTTMLRYFREAGLPLRVTGHSKGGHPTARQEKAHELRDNGLSYGEIAKELKYAGSGGAYRAVRRASEKMSLALNNHKVVAVVPAGNGAVYDMTVDGPENFGLACGVFVHNSYLKKAIRSVGRLDPSKRPALKALIIRRARELGAGNAPGVKGTWPFEAANDGEAIDLATSGRMPLIRGAADIQMGRTAPGVISVMHKSSGMKVGVIKPKGAGYGATHGDGTATPASGSQQGALAGLIAYHNKMAAQKNAKARDAAQSPAAGIASVKGYAGDQPALDFAAPVPAVTSGDGPRVTSMGGGKASPKMAPEVAVVYAKLRKKGMKPGQAMALAKRAAAMHAKAAA